MVLFLLFSLLNIYIFWNSWSTSLYLDLPFKPCMVFPFINLTFQLWISTSFYILKLDCSQYSEESLALYQSISLREGCRGCPPPPVKMTCGFLTQLYKICCSFDMYSRQFTLCYCPVNVYVTSQLHHSLLVHPRHPLPRKIQLHKKGSVLAPGPTRSHALSVSMRSRFSQPRSLWARDGRGLSHIFYDGKGRGRQSCGDLFFFFFIHIF